MSKIIKTLEEAINQIVLCKDGFTRRLLRFDKKFGYYAIPIGTTQEMEVGAVRIAIVRNEFIDQPIVDNWS